MASDGIHNINGLPRMTQQTHISHGMRFMADNIVKKDMIMNTQILEMDDIL